MKIPGGSTARPGWRPPQISPISSNILNKKDEDEDDVIDTFEKLSLSSNLSKTSDPLFLHIRSDKEQETKKDNDSDSDSESNSSSDYSRKESSDEENEDNEDGIFITKGPDKGIKKTKEYRQQGVPYTESFLNRPHHSGGSLSIFDTFPFYELNSQASQEEVTDDDWSFQINDLLNKLTSVERASLDNAVERMFTLEEIETISHTDSSLRNDDDSAYDTSSPNSTAYESESPISPFSDNQHEYSYNVRNIPCVRRSITIAPEPTVYETEMKKTAVERIKHEFKKNRRNSLDVEWIKVLQDEEFKHYKNENHETKLMAHLRNKSNVHYKEIIHAMLDRIEKQKFLNLLQYVNPKGESALSIAVYELKDKAIIARYILEVLYNLGQNPEEIDRKGNSWIHQLAICGDEYVQVMAEFLNMKTANGLAFDVNKRNMSQETPLHIAVKRHSQTFSTLAITKLLINHNADISLKDQHGLTAVHLAVKCSCNSQLIKALLSSNYVCRAAIATDPNGDTALHYAAAKNDLHVNHQLEIILQLFRSQWSLKATNKDNKIPLAFTDIQRKKYIQDQLSRK